MAKQQRRQSQNGQYMREILIRLREYDIEEIELLCRKYLQKHRLGSGPVSSRRSSRRFKRKTVQ